MNLEAIPSFGRPTPSFSWLKQCLCRGRSQHHNTWAEPCLGLGHKAGASSGSSAQGSCSPELGPCEDGCGLLCGRAGPERLTRACDFFPFEFIRGSARMVSRYRVSTAFILPSSQLIVERTLTLQGASPRLCVSLHLGPLLATGAGSAQAPRGREVTSRGQCVT